MLFHLYQRRYSQTLLCLPVSRWDRQGRKRREHLEHQEHQRDQCYLDHPAAQRTAESQPCHKSVTVHYRVYLRSATTQQSTDFRKSLTFKGAYCVVVDCWVSYPGSQILMLWISINIWWPGNESRNSITVPKNTLHYISIATIKKKNYFECIYLHSVYSCYWCNSNLHNIRRIRV